MIARDDGGRKCHLMGFSRLPVSAMPRVYRPRSALNDPLRTPFAAPRPLEGANARHAYVSPRPKDPLDGICDHDDGIESLSDPSAIASLVLYSEKQFQINFHSSVIARIQPNHREPTLRQASRAMAGRPSLDVPILQQAFWTMAGGREAAFAPRRSSQRSALTPACRWARITTREGIAKNVVQ